MKINGKTYTSLFAHMQDGSIKVKKGQKIEAGTPLGKMGTTGMSTGKHLHWELRLGNKHIWDANGKNYIEPIGFFKALIASEKAIASAAVVATKDDPVAPAPEHNEVQAAAVDAELAAKKAEAKAVAAPAPVTKPAAKPAKPALAGELKVGSTGPAVKWLQTRLGLDATGTFDNVTKAAVIKFQKTRKEITKPDGAVGNLTWKALG
jgi:murein DD-endopeptidase MepM/ murein hydrolase activator NlpD